MLARNATLSRKDHMPVRAMSTTAPFYPGLSLSRDGSLGLPSAISVDIGL